MILQDATRATSAFPPGFARMFNRTVIGVATKTDILTASTQRASRFLLSAGAAQVVEISAVTAAGVDELRSALAIRA